MKSSAPNGHKRAKMSPPSPPTPPDMSLLHAPVARGWGKAEWSTWSTGDEAHCDRRTATSDDPPYDYIDPFPEELGGFDGYLRQRNDAVLWAAPEEISVRLGVTEDAASDGPIGFLPVPAPSRATEPTSPPTKTRDFRLTKNGGDTFRSLVDRYCAENDIERDDYHWMIKGQGKMSPGALFLSQTDQECFSKLWNCHPPTLVARFVDDGNFRPQIIGWRKVPPPSGPPTEAPSFAELSSPPPEGNAPRAEWKAWHRKNSGGPCEFWRDKKEAVQWRCPARIDIVLKGLAHEHTLQVNADEPLSIALASYCSSIPEDVDSVVLPLEVLLRERGGEDHTFVDAQEKSARMLFYGYSPLRIEVVYRDARRTEAELEAQRGPTPAGYTRFQGSGYLLSDTEQPWFVTEGYGIDTYNEIGKEALMIYKGTDSEPAYNPVDSWFDMTSKLKKILAAIVRKPSGGWSVEGAAKSLDGLTAALLNLARNDDWSRDARGKMLFWNPDCRKESIAVLRKMDAVAVAAIKAAKSFVSETPSQQGGGEFGLERALGQLKRLMIKYRGNYSGFSEDDYDYRGYTPFSKALALVG